MKLPQRTEASKLRREGKSLREIAEVVQVSLSTASRWCKDVPVDEDKRVALQERRRSAGIEALRPWIEKNRMLKKEDVETQKKTGILDLGEVSERDLFIMGLGLYWGEGYKRGSQEWGFTNSDPSIIRVVMTWMTRFYGVDKERYVAHLTINENFKDAADELIKFWSEETGIPVQKFSAPTFIVSKRPAIHRGNRSYVGTFRLKIRNSTSLRRRILASIAHFEEGIKAPHAP